MEFKIGDRVRLKDYNDIPQVAKNKRIGMVAGCEGEITDKLYSEAKGCTVYQIHFDGFDRPSRYSFMESSFELIEEEKVEYSYEFEFLENLVVARLYEIKGGEKTEIAKGHGHIFHDGLQGIAQASSYAMKRIYEKINGGNL